ncbi:MAG: glycosyl transferase [Bacteroidetes bacterium]|nr:MAG: glycosyl transferase [Bacteroidota bacterium]
MLTFCTLFDRNYLARGLAMHESLLRVNDTARLFVFAFDDLTAEILERMDLPRLIVVRQREFENAGLLAVKPTRTAAEYCWTATPAIVLHVLERYGADHCTYIDADLFFFSDPAPLLRELGPSSVLLSPHRYTPRYDLTRLSGRYCVQFNSFRNTPEGLTALRWWNERCLEWCYAREEDGKFGDQKYLDDWTVRFPGVHELRHLGGGVAPWNVQQYSFSEEGERIRGRERRSGTEFDLVFYHFHYLRFYRSGRVDLGDYRLDGPVLRVLYRRYLQKLESAVERLSGLKPGEDWYGRREEPAGWEGWSTMVKRRLKGQYNVLSASAYRAFTGRER